MRVLLCGGGTGGHVMPAIAMGEIIEKKFPGSTIAYAGRVGGDENNAYVESGHRLYTLDVSGLRRSFSPNNIKSIIKVIKSGRMASKVIKEFKPDLIIGTGGYVCFPFIRQGQRLGIKTVIHESNVAAGLVTKLLFRRCDKLLLNLEGTKKHLRGSENAVVVGNPIRSDFSVLSRSDARKRLGIREGEILIVSFGGSLGAELLNRTVGEMISNYTAKDKRIRHVHSTGRANYERMKRDFPKLFIGNTSLKILPYIDNMPLLLTAADIAITRSGAMTLSELARSKTPAILIPSPNVTANHQYINAKYMEDIGAAIVIEESELTPKRLHDEIMAIIESDEKMRIMSKRMYSANKKDTDDKIAQVISEITGEKTIG